MMYDTILAAISSCEGINVSQAIPLQVSMPGSWFVTMSFLAAVQY